MISFWMMSLEGRQTEKSKCFMVSQCLSLVSSMNSILKHFLISTCYNDGGEEKHGKQILFAHKKIFSSTFILKVQEVVKQIPLPEKRKNSWRNDQAQVWSNKWCVGRERDIEEEKREHHIQNCIKQRRNYTYHHDVMKKKGKEINFQEQIHHY